jgi:hypothetical protein
MPSANRARLFVRYDALGKTNLASHATLWPNVGVIGKPKKVPGDEITVARLV